MNAPFTASPYPGLSHVPQSPAADDRRWLWTRDRLPEVLAFISEWHHQLSLLTHQKQALIMALPDCQERRELAARTIEAMAEKGLNV